MSLWTEEDVIARTVRQHEAQKAVSRPTAPIRATIRPRTTKGTADWSDALYGQLRALQLPLPEREYRFDASRKWRMDLAWVERKIYAECDAGNSRKGGTDASLVCSLIARRRARQRWPAGGTFDLSARRFDQGSRLGF